MELQIVYMLLGFVFASYAVVGNDVIQTLGTFISSNSHRKWYVLWGYTAVIMIVVLTYGWVMYEGDVSYGRLEKVPIPEVFEWWHVIPPIVLMLITRIGIPVSTTFLILSVFSSALISKMLTKSLIGYGVAFGTACVIYLLISKSLENRFRNSPMTQKDEKLWSVLQWISTGFLWSQWLIQDLANIYTFLPRQLDTVYFIFSLVIIVGLQAYTFYNQGGAVQKVVTTKTNTQDIRSATIIDFLYAIILLIFKKWSKIPMSTTWVFVGLLAGRELMLHLQLNTKSSFKAVWKIILYDLLKVFAGLVVSVALVYLLQWLAQATN